MSETMSDERLAQLRARVERAEKERARVAETWPMSREWKEADGEIALWLLTKGTARELLDEVERLRAREAALLAHGEVTP